jgi:hypothetical protein
VFGLVGIHVPVDTFVAVAGGTELLFGLRPQPGRSGMALIPSTAGATNHPGRGVSGKTGSPA